MSKLSSKDDIIQFSLSAEEFILKNDYNYVEGFVEYCNFCDMDMDDAIKLISQNLKAKIEESAVDQHLIKRRGAKLPL